MKEYPRLKKTAIGIGVIILLVVLFYAVENYRGKRAWEEFNQELAARGTPIDWDWKHYLPPEVPDDQNFAKTPFLEKTGYGGKHARRKRVQQILYAYSL